MSPRLASPSHRRSPSESPAADPTRPAVSVGLVFAICLIAASLRTGLTGVGTLLPAIERGSDLTSSWGGLLSTPSADVRRDITPGGPGLPPVRHRTPAGDRPRRTDGGHRGPVTSLGDLPVHRHRDPFRCHRVRQGAAARADPTERARTPHPGHQRSLRHGHGRHCRGLLRDRRAALPHLAGFLAHRSRLGCRLHRRGIPRLAAPDAGRPAPIRQTPHDKPPLPPAWPAARSPGGPDWPNWPGSSACSWACRPWPPTPSPRRCPAF